MNVFEAIGMLWVIFTSVLATLMIGYLTMVGLKTVVKETFLGKNLASLELPSIEKSDAELGEPLKVALR